VEGFWGAFKLCMCCEIGNFARTPTNLSYSCSPGPCQGAQAAAAAAKAALVEGLRAKETALAAQVADLAAAREVAEQAEVCRQGGLVGVQACLATR
jgi:hypothetical protein